MYHSFWGLIIWMCIKHAIDRDSSHGFVYFFFAYVVVFECGLIQSLKRENFKSFKYEQMCHSLISKYYKYSYGFVL